MCGRYTLVAEAVETEMRALIERCNRKALSTGNLIALGDVRPGDCAPGFVAEQGAVRAVSMRWGFAREGGGLIINARSEGVRERALFRNLEPRFRCALPAGGYYEWRDGDHLKHLIAMPGGALYLAGLYRPEEAGKARFVVLTRASTGDHASIHGRMPLVLADRDEVRAWLLGALSIEELAARPADRLAIRAMGAEQMRMDFEETQFEE